MKPQFKSVCLFALTYKDTVCFHWSQNAACYIEHVFSVVVSVQAALGLHY